MNQDGNIFSKMLPDEAHGLETAGDIGAGRLPLNLSPRPFADIWAIRILAIRLFPANTGNSLFPVPLKQLLSSSPSLESMRNVSPSHFRRAQFQRASFHPRERPPHILFPCYRTRKIHIRWCRPGVRGSRWDRWKRKWRKFPVLFIRIKLPFPLQVIPFPFGGVHGESAPGIWPD